MEAFYQKLEMAKDVAKEKYENLKTYVESEEYKEKLDEAQKRTNLFAQEVSTDPKATATKYGEIMGDAIKDFGDRLNAGVVGFATAMTSEPKMNGEPKVNGEPKMNSDPKMNDEQSGFAKQVQEYMFKDTPVEGTVAYQIFTDMDKTKGLKLRPQIVIDYTNKSGKRVERAVDPDIQRYLLAFNTSGVPSSNTPDNKPDVQPSE